MGLPASSSTATTRVPLTTASSSSATDASQVVYSSYQSNQIKDLRKELMNEDVKTLQDMLRFKDIIDNSTSKKKLVDNIINNKDPKQLKRRDFRTRQSQFNSLILI